MSSVTVGTVKIRTACVPLLKDNLNRISVLYAAHLIEKVEGLAKDGFTELEVCTTSYATDLLVRVQRYVDDICREGCTTTTLHLHHQQQQQQQHPLHQIGHLLTDSGGGGGGGGCGVLAGAGDDSSYDSDYENDTPPAPVGSKATPGSVGPGCIGSVTHQQQLYHHDVSRTTSDTLAAEYADYVQTNESSENVVAAAPGYTARVEFALKLGYTERLVQTALAKLGPAPAQNELLAELIKLGAQRGAGGGGPGSASSDGSGSPIESLLGLDGNLDVSANPLVGGFAAAQNIASTLRPIVIDGSNVAMSHGNKEIFSCRGIKICVDYFRSRGHRDITVFVPKWRKEAPRPDNPVQDQEILAELERERLLVFTPSRLVGGKRTVCYDDRYILKLAAEVDGIVVSNDNYRDLCQENTEYRRVVDERVLMYTFVNDRFMPPDDPLGRAGPTLDNFLKLSGRNTTALDPIVTPPPCPYAKKCTYGNKCKYHHPERGPLPHKSVTERLSEHAQRHLQARDSTGSSGAGNSCTGGKIPLGRTRSVVPCSQQQQENMVAGHVTVSKSRSVDACVNLHRKLQRQLTLNPGVAQSYYVPYWDQGNKSQQRPSLQQSHLQQQQQHHLQQQQQYLQHQHVTRIASAPDAPHQHHQQRVAPLWPPPSAAATSCSEPQLWPPQQHNALQVPTGSAASHREESRRRMHYHLAAIFPEEQVARAMRLYPEETNPQTICAAILSMQQQCRK